ncbi:hypothetical protein CDD83_2887 [Cordyceps sp. RAO-2017]|nr:hypothetical protein CDD83_2887 [Cordyceps sp. RAO-2017]
MSAIIKGLRRTDKVQSKPSRPNETIAWGSVGRTEKALAGSGSNRQRQKLSKKLDRRAAQRQEEEEDGPQSRRKRFVNPDMPFGKKSLVYRIKHGDLKEKAASLQLQEPERPKRRIRGRVQPKDPEEWDEDQNVEYSLRRDRLSEDPDADAERFEPPVRDRGVNRLLTRLNPLPLTYEPEPKRELAYPMLALAKTHHQIEISQENETSHLPGITRSGAIFLYGRSTVLAALKHAKRKLYKLYMYGGADRKNKATDDEILDLAKQRGVEVDIVSTERRALLDKLSMNRPHNGVLLEASEVPKQPVKSLGEVEEAPGRLGFHVKLGYQSREEAAVNGEDTFVRRPNGVAPKPFVLLLNHIVDPGNLGNMVRSANFLGVDAVALTDSNSAGLA